VYRLYGALVTLSLIWGLSFVFIKVLVGPAGVWGVVFLRCLFGALVLLPFLLMKGRSQWRSLPWRTLLFVGVFNAGVPWGLIALSETEIHSSTASILNATTPIWTSLMGVWFYEVQPSKKQWIGIFTGFFGILFLMEFQVSELFTTQFIGVGTMLLAAMCYGFASQHTRRHLKDVDVLMISTATLVIGCVIGLIGVLFTGGFSVAAMIRPEPLAALIGLGVFGSGVAYLLNFYMIKQESAEFAVNVTYLVPVTAVVWGAVLLGEPISLHQIIGLLVIFLGVYLSTRKGKATPIATHLSTTWTASKVDK
jgi:drug/metabolite transporter (DMT)-like permease